MSGRETEQSRSREKLSGERTSGYAGATSKMGTLRIIVHDYCGHPFPVQLSRELARRGYTVTHLYCDSNPTTPKGRLTLVKGDPKSLSIVPVPLPQDVEKSAFANRWRLEKLYGERLVIAVAQLQPGLVISANTPLDAQDRLLNYCRRADVPFVYWVQDVISEAAYRILRRKIPGIGQLVGLYYRHKEKRLFRKSDYLVGITEDFGPFFRNAGVPKGCVTTIPNWAPFDEIVPTTKDNPWSRRFDLQDKFVFLYSGTLGFKHNPKMLLALARQMANHPYVRVVVNSQGDAAEWLRQQKKKLSLDALMVNPYQPYKEMSNVLGTADVLVAILEPYAGIFSVPSKVLAYHCAGRPMLLAVPEENLAAKIVRDNGAGLVGNPSDTILFCRNAESLYHDHQNKGAMGLKAQAYAIDNFDIGKITDRFEEIFQHVTAGIMP
jgi:colanic acid biosynthesis glycosyl transferase WcaI